MHRGMTGKKALRLAVQQSSACSGQVIDRQIISGKRIGKIRRFSRWKKLGSQMVRCCNAQMKDVPVGRRGAVTVSVAGDYGTGS